MGEGEGRWGTSSFVFRVEGRWRGLEEWETLLLHVSSRGVAKEDRNERERGRKEHEGERGGEASFAFRARVRQVGGNK